MDNLVAKDKEQCKKVAEGILRRAQRENSPRGVFSRGNGLFADWDLGSENYRKFLEMLHPEALIGIYDSKAKVEYLAADLKDCGRV